MGKKIIWNALSAPKSSTVLCFQMSNGDSKSAEISYMKHVKIKVIKVYLENVKIRFKKMKSL